MTSTLPPIDTDSYREYEGAVWREEAEQRIAGIASHGWHLDALNKIESLTPAPAPTPVPAQPVEAPANALTDGSGNWATEAQQRIESLAAPAPDVPDVPDAPAAPPPPSVDDPYEMRGMQRPDTPVASASTPVRPVTGQSAPTASAVPPMRPLGGQRLGAPDLTTFDPLSAIPRYGQPQQPQALRPELPAAQTEGATITPEQIGQSWQDANTALDTSPLAQWSKDQLATGRAEEVNLLTRKGLITPQRANELLDMSQNFAMGAEAAGPGVEAIGQRLGGYGRPIAAKVLDKLATTDLPAGAKAIANTAEQEVARLRLDKFPEDLRGLIRQGAEQMDFAAGQRRGVISDQAAETMADELGRTTEQWIRQGKAGRAYSTEEIRALANAITTQASRVKEIGAAIAKPGGNSDLAIAQQIIEGDKLAALVALREGAKAEAGRSLRAFAQEARLATNPEEAISRIFAKVGGADKAREMASQYATLVEQGADPIQMAQFWSRVENPAVKWGDWFRALRYNSMLSGPRSMEVDLAGTAAEVPWKLTRDFFASAARSAGTRSLQPMRELGPEVAGIFRGASKGGEAMLQQIAHGITAENALRGELPRDLMSRLDNPAAKAAAASLEWVTRFKGGLNELQHQTAYGMAYGRLAGRQATREGLKGAAWQARVDELIAQPLDRLMRQATGDAERLTYSNDLGRFGRATAKFREDAGVAGHVVLPFYKTIVNITARGVDRSPLGLAGTAIDVARGKYGGVKQLGKALSGEMLPTADKGLRPLGERLGDNIMGTAIGLWFTDQAFKGNISASGPTNPRERDVLRAQGWQPYSVKLGDKWVSYGNWGPAAISLAGAASIAEANIYKAPKDNAVAVTADAMRRFGEVFSEQTYLQSVGAVYKAIREPDRYGGQWINSFMTSLVPEGSLVNTIGQASDPVNREVTPGISPQSIGEALQYRIPGARQNLPVKRTVFGDAEPNPYYGPAGVLSPLRVSPEPNPATANIRRYNGSRSAMQDQQIAQAVERYTNWLNHPREYERPTQQEIALAKQFNGRENPRYQQLISQAAARARRENLARQSAGGARS